jgi:carboxylesterase type B
MGLRDQQLAMRWIHEHIAHFGGDPRRVTLFGQCLNFTITLQHIDLGESAGGASVVAHMFAPDSYNLFGRIIAKSGAIVNNWATKSRAVIRQISFKLVHRLNCTQGLMDGANTAAERAQLERIVECLSRVPAPIVQRESDAISESLMLPMNFAFVPIDEDTHFFKVGTGKLKLGDPMLFRETCSRSSDEKTSRRM